jgi:hypothetical protein
MGEVGSVSQDHDAVAGDAVNMRANGSAPFGWLPLAVVLAGVVFSLGMQALVRPDVYFSGDGGMKALLTRHMIAWPPRLDLALRAPVWVRELWDQGLYPFSAPYAYRIGDLWFAEYSFPFLVASAVPLALFGQRGLYLLPLLSTWVVWLAVWRVARRRGWGPRETAVVLGGLVFASPLTFYGATFWEHNLAIALAMVGMLPALAAPDRPSAPRAFAFGLAMGLAIWFREELLCLVGIWALVAAWARWRKERDFFPMPRPSAWFAGTVFAVGLYCTLNWVFYGHLLGVHSFPVLKEAFSLGSRLGNAAVLLVELLGMLILWFPIVIFVAVFALPRLLPARAPAPAQERLLAWTLVLYCLAVPLALPDVRFGGNGGKQWGPRFWLVAVPLSLLLVPDTLHWARQLERRTLRRVVPVVLLALLAMSVWINSVEGMRLLSADYSSRVLPALEFLRRQPVRIVAVDSQFVSQELLPGLEDRATFFAIPDDTALPRLVQGLVAHGEHEFILVRSKPGLIPRRVQLGEHLFVRFETLGLFGRYQLVHAAITAS